MRTSIFSKSIIAKFVVGALLWAIGSSSSIATDTIDPALLSAMEWRLVGPYRGGRVTTVAGVADNPQLYYMGATGGGVWKTGNAGLTWENISDDFFGVGTIGAVAVAESDPNVIYVGTGEKSIRGVTTSQGDGIYKSTDAGATWTHIGLPKAGQIARIKIYPTNPDVAYAAAQGQIWGPNPERGVYRTTDGGETWELKNGSRILWTRSWYYMHIAADPVNEDIVYVLNAPFMKSIDGGVTFEKKTTPHGDHHDHWINPHNNKNMINANDGGATITFDGGESWSSIMNQPTAQSGSAAMMA